MFQKNTFHIMTKFLCLKVAGIEPFAFFVDDGCVVDAVFDDGDGPAIHIVENRYLSPP